MIIVSTDSPYEGESSAMGIRALQLFNIFRNITKTTLLVPDINYSSEKNIGVPFDFNKKELDLKEISIVPMNIYDFKIKGEYIVDGFSPLLVENLFTKTHNIKKISNLIRKSKGIIYTTPQQKSFYIGILSLLRIIKPLFYIPLYLPISKKRFQQKNNKIIIVYGGIYPWVDLDRILQTFSKFPKNYKLLFKGVKHPRYKRDKGYELLKEKLESFQRKEDIIIDLTWDNKVIEVEGSIFFAKEYEKNVACRTRILDLVSQGIPVLTDPEESTFSLLREYNGVYSNVELFLKRKSVKIKRLLKKFAIEKIILNISQSFFEFIIK